jgi:hypothetical protein
VDEVFLKVRNCLNQLTDLAKELQALGVIRSQKIVSDYGEWIACRLLKGTPSDSRTQKGWDIKVGDKHIQVKTHAKAQTNRTRWTPIPKTPDFHELLIIVLSPKYLVSDIFLVPVKDCKTLRDKSGNYWKLSWNKIDEFRFSGEKLADIEPLLASTEI